MIIILLFALALIGQAMISFSEGDTLGGILCLIMVAFLGTASLFLQVYKCKRHVNKDRKAVYERSPGVTHHSIHEGYRNKHSRRNDDELVEGAWVSGINQPDNCGHRSADYSGGFSGGGSDSCSSSSSSSSCD